MIFDEDKEHWTALFVTIRDNTWSGRFMDPVDSFGQQTCFSAQAKFDILLTTQAGIIGHRAPIFMQSEVVSISFISIDYYQPVLFDRPIV